MLFNEIKANILVLVYMMIYYWIIKKWCVESKLIWNKNKIKIKFKGNKSKWKVNISISGRKSSTQRNFAKTFQYLNTSAEAN